MAAQLARPHSHLSNRAKVRSAVERKPVFKSVLENPFQISWPAVPVDTRGLVLPRLMAALENIPSRTRASRKAGVSGQQGNATRALDQVSSASQHVVVGINQVTRALESQLHASRRRVVVDNSHCGDQPLPHSELSPIVVVFVCCADIDPLALVDHIPYLVAGYNSAKNVSQRIKLVPLPKGSEPIISQTLGVRRAAVVGFRHGSPLSGAFEDILDSVPVLSAPWLCPPDSQGAAQLVPTHIKQLLTTAPKDIKAAREQRSKARAAAKKSASRSVRRKPRVTLVTGSASSR